MDHQPEIPTDFAPGDSDADLTALIGRLESERPVPRPAFRGDLRRRLLASAGQPQRSRQQAFAAVIAYASSGAFLLAVGAIALVGVGPFAV